MIVHRCCSMTNSRTLIAHLNIPLSCLRKKSTPLCRYHCHSTQNSASTSLRLAVIKNQRSTQKKFSLRGTWDSLLKKFQLYTENELKPFNHSCLVRTFMFHETTYFWHVSNNSFWKNDWRAQSFGHAKSNASRKFELIIKFIFADLC